jgi:hypothetical protein
MKFIELNMILRQISLVGRGANKSAGFQGGLSWRLQSAQQNDCKENFFHSLHQDSWVAYYQYFIYNTYLKMNMDAPGLTQKEHQACRSLFLSPVG